MAASEPLVKEECGGIAGAAPAPFVRGCYEVICIPSSDSETENVIEVCNASTPLLTALSSAAHAAAPAHSNSTGDTQSSARSSARGILDFFSPVAKREITLDTSPAASSSHESPFASDGAICSSSIPVIVNPVFTEVHLEPTGAAASSSPAPNGQPQPLFPSHQHSSASSSSFPPLSAASAPTFCITVSMISGRNMAVALPCTLLHRTRGEELQSNDEDRCAAPLVHRPPLPPRPSPFTLHPSPITLHPSPFNPLHKTLFFCLPPPHPPTPRKQLPQFLTSAAGACAAAGSGAAARHPPAQDVKVHRRWRKLEREIIPPPPPRPHSPFPSTTPPPPQQMSTEKFIAAMRRSPPPEILLILKL